MLQLERRKDKHGLNTWITDTYQVGRDSHGPIFRGVISVLNSPNSQTPNEPYYVVRGAGLVTHRARPASSG